MNNGRLVYSPDAYDYYCIQPIHTICSGGRPYRLSGEMIKRKKCIQKKCQNLYLEVRK